MLGMHGPTLSRGSDSSPDWSVHATKGASDAEVLAESGHVAGCLDVVVGAGDLPVWVDHEGRPDHTDRLLAVKHLLPVGAVGLFYLVAGVGQQGEVQAVAVAEPGELGRRVRGDPEDRDPGRGQGLDAVAEVARFL